MIYFQVGGQVGYLLSAKYNGIDYKEDLKTIDYGGVVAAGIEIPGTHFGIGARLYLGLGGIYKDEAAYDKVSHLAYSAGLHYYF